MCPRSHSSRRSSSLPSSSLCSLHTLEALLPLWELDSTAGFLPSPLDSAAGVEDVAVGAAETAADAGSSNHMPGAVQVEVVAVVTGTPQHLLCLLALLQPALRQRQVLFSRMLRL